MLRPNRKKVARRLALLTGMLILVGAEISRQTQAQTQWGQIKDGVGVGEILIGASSAADVEARYGTNHKLLNMNDYSYRMDYVEQGLAFYYCLKDDKKRIFLIELHHGLSSKGIVVGESTLKDVFRLYGETANGGSFIYEYPGIQFYVEHDAKTDGEDKAPKLDKKVVEIDIVAPDKSSNFCDEYLPPTPDK